MVVDKIAPNDSRVSHEYAILNGHRYHYLLAVPDDGKYRGTVFLIHGWPDLSFGWRYQIPALLSQRLRVVVPDQMGYGGTDAPRVPPADISVYGFKQASDNIAALAKILDAPRIILGGHDWGGMVVYRCAAYYPDLVTHVFSVCTPYMAPSDKYVSTEELVQGPLPQFGYQLHLAGPEIEAALQTPESISRFLAGMYGARSGDGKPMFSPEQGIDFTVMNKCGAPLLLTEEELAYYVAQYSRNGMHGPLNWYRTRRANFEDELELESKTIKQPVLFIAGSRDNVLKPEMSKGMEAFIPKLTRREVPSGHWALTQTPKETNGFIIEWLSQTVFGRHSHL